MERKETYTLQELFEVLPLSIAELARQSGINERTLAHMRDGKPARRSTVNKLLLMLSRIYDRPLSLQNVTGLHVQAKKRLGAKGGKDEERRVAGESV